MDLKLDFFILSESCLAIYDVKRENFEVPFILLHSENCWFRSGHICPDLPDHNLNVELMDKTDSLVNSNITHTFLQSVVLGDLTMSGCFIDWDVVKSLGEVAC